ncbi:hypothetical protein GCM10009775_03390 [Microbacterium aoyamense]|uniref:DUF4349 domain-containing protein n=1 Tax=Microbacterium aoyamense TaxID=344166 RepID=A0ABN2P6Z5_9MICO|nr:DUF4349 domain-containing protein [Microbacterium aoyamense]
MNTQRDDTSLPPLSDARIDEIEDALFADIGRERRSDRTRRAKRGRIWMASGAAAAVVAIAAIIAPSVGGIVGGGAVNEAGVAPASDSGVDFASTPMDGAKDLGGAEIAEGARTGGEESAATTDRDIITTASASVTVDDVTVAARSVGRAAEARGGYVESMNVGTSGGTVPIDPSTGMRQDSIAYPYPSDGAWVTVRVPTDQLAPLIEELSDLGDVTASSINRQDVTEQTVDLRARIESAQASVDRLTELMTQASSVADLIAAEAALSERQATLESYQQQLEMLEGQVELSTLTVTLSPVVETVEADPAGFWDGLVAGWNGLVATVNGIVIALGFLIPWIVVVGLMGWGVWAIVRAVRRRRRAKAAPPDDLG